MIQTILISPAKLLFPMDLTSFLYIFMASKGPFLWSSLTFSPYAISSEIFMDFHAGFLLSRYVPLPSQNILLLPPTVTSQLK